MADVQDRHIFRDTSAPVEAPAFAGPTPPGCRVLDEIATRMAHDWVARAAAHRGMSYVWSGRRAARPYQSPANPYRLFPSVMAYGFYLLHAKHEPYHSLIFFFFFF